MLMLFYVVICYFSLCVSILAFICVALYQSTIKMSFMCMYMFVLKHNDHMALSVWTMEYRKVPKVKVKFQRPCLFVYQML